MAKYPMSLEKLLERTSDEILIEMQEEMLCGVVPVTGSARSFVRKINRMIDQGALCINTTTYRKIYLPTLAKAVQEEFARRYVRLIYNRKAGLTDYQQIILEV